MRKIITLFVRDAKTFRVINQVAEGCEWVTHGEGVPTKKWDGTCCMFRDKKLFKRYDGTKSKFLPPDFIPAENAESHWLGWRPVGDDPEDRWFVEALKASGPLPDGTYELIGPKINKNEENSPSHSFRHHGDIRYPDDTPRDFDGLREWFKTQNTEGIVFHHPDGRMVKIKKKDFGLPRNPSLSRMDKVMK